MEENPKLVEIFEESTFKKIFPKLFSSPISVTQLEKETGVSRTTIYKIFKTLDNIKTKNYVGIEGVLGKKDKFYYFKTELLVDYLTELAKLTPEERYVLKNFLENTTIFKKFNSLDELLFALIFVFIVEQSYRNEIKEVSLFSSYKFLKNFMSPFLKNITPEEEDQLIQNILKFGKEKDFKSLSDKFMELEKNFVVSPKVLLQYLGSFFIVFKVLYILPISKRQRSELFRKLGFDLIK